MAANDLCQLADVKLWLGRTDANSDALLAALITRASRAILSYLRRGFLLPHSVSERRDGTGTTAMVLKQWPVIAVNSVTIEDRKPSRTELRAGPAKRGTARRPVDRKPCR